MAKTILTCAVTGGLTKPEMTPYLPITPNQIADSCLGAADAGAAAVHIHVRDPISGSQSMDFDLYAKVVELIRMQNKELIINLTTGPGGRFIPSEDDPKVFAPGTTLCHPLKRVEHIAKLKPDICSLDFNTMNGASDIVINTPLNVRKMAKVIRDAGVLPELEIFDTGDLNLALDLISDGTLDGPGLFSFVLGVKYGLNADPATLLYLRDQLPLGARWSAFGISRFEFPIVAQAWLYGGHTRVGLEDNIFLKKGVLCQSNAELVTKAKRIIEDLGGELASAVDARAMLGLKIPV
ncbi:COG3246 Uncharacterized conserved protein [Burkholderiaceae bacterium]|jgi:uncharacterized protein (DUF849 family)